MLQAVYVLVWTVFVADILESAAASAVTYYIVLLFPPTPILFIYVHIACQLQMYGLYFCG